MQKSVNTINKPIPRERPNADFRAMSCYSGHILHIVIVVDNLIWDNIFCLSLA